MLLRMHKWMRETGSGFLGKWVYLFKLVPKLMVFTLISFSRFGKLQLALCLVLGLSLGWHYYY